ncbi:plantaricin C family lantibiotic [Bacillus thuringiensis]|uniref:plantaricin C family lantibiotic n=1 Tax=Bacillus thuringiensis TaxID=1428 RepID=UPI0037FA13B3|nr:plantaricin C family lantibiotic [Bacillus cereus]MCU5348062.1 plantaricin C family lantibiotic [Bacillus cereus]
MRGKKMFSQKSYLLKNPVAKNKFGASMTNPSGDIITEIQEQELESVNGGITPTVGWSAVVVSTTIVNSAVVVSVSATNYGRVCTISAECSSGYKRCD